MRLFWNQKRVFKKMLTSKKKCFCFGITRVNDLKIFNNPFPTCWKTGLDMSEKKKLVGGLTTLVFNSKVWWHWPSVPPLRRAFGRTRNAGESHRRCGHTVERRCGRTVENMVLGKTPSYFEGVLTCRRPPAMVFLGCLCWFCCHEGFQRY